MVNLSNLVNKCLQSSVRTKPLSLGEDSLIIQQPNLPFHIIQIMVTFTMDNIEIDSNIIIY